MKVEKAIAILDDCRYGALLGISQDTKDAIGLGQEALERIQAQRRYIKIAYKDELPSETPEEEVEKW